MPLTNTPQHYGSVTKFFHWSIALLFIFQYGSAIIFTGMTDGDPKWNILGAHKTIGFLVLVLAILRITWRKTTRLPDWAKTMTEFEKQAAHAIENGLYTSMFVMTVSGYIMEMAGGYEINFFYLFQVPDILGKSVILEVISLYAHKVTAFLIIAFISAHLSLVLKHQLGDKDDFIRRMLPSKD